MSQHNEDDKEINRIGIFFCVVGVIFLIVIFLTDSPVKHAFMNMMY